MENILHAFSLDKTGPDVGTKITVMENILHAFSLDKSEPERGTLIPTSGPCLRDSAVLTGYLFRQRPACVRVPNSKNVLL